MRVKTLTALCVSLCVIGFAGSAHAASGLRAYTINIADGRTLQTLAQKGFDVTEARVGQTIQVVATAAQASELQKFGAKLQARTKARFDPTYADGSWDNYRPYFDHTYVGTVDHTPTGAPRQTLYEEILALANAHTNIAKPEVIGYSINHKPILAVRVTKDARQPTNPDGSRPAVVYGATQHAREWIVPETDRRLLHLFLDNYGQTGTAIGTDGQPVDGVSSEELTNLVNTRELWFVVVANPDGYDFTFTPGNREWRKNLHDNNSDGVIDANDGVDPNRNYPGHWGYDNEGSSDDPTSETYRGTGPASEPETQAMMNLWKKVGPEYMINYHSAAELLLYGLGFQVQTNSEDDPIYRALAGNDDDPAIPGKAPGAPDPYHSEVASELYTTNGELDETAHENFGILTFTPEMDVSDPARGGGDSVFDFQDSDADLQDAFEKNVPFALDVAKSAADPENPVSHLGNTAPSFEIHPFDTSYGSPQTVEVNAKRSLGDVTVHWEVNGGAEHTAATTEWTGGEVYGGDLAQYYHRVRASIGGVQNADVVKVWFTAGGQKSQAFSYNVRHAAANSVLIMAAEDYTGKPGNSAQEDPVITDRTQPSFLGYYTAALDSLHVSYDVYDVDAEGRKAPDPLGILSHYKAVIWYTGNDNLIREPAAPGATGTSRLANDEIVAVRDYMNEGGKLVYTGQNAATSQLIGYQFNPEGEPPYCKASDASSGTVTNCSVLSNDFLQYWLGAYVHLTPALDHDAASALAMRLVPPFGSTPFGLNGPDSADNQDNTYSLLTTSSVLPPSQFPQFTSQRAAEVDGPDPFAPQTGTHYAVAQSDDEAYQRLRQTIDLTGASSGHLRFKISYDTEPDYDYVFVEAHHVGQDDWTTLPDANGNTSTDVGLSCDINWDTLHPFLAHYQTNTNKSDQPGDEDCTGTGTTGAWNAATGSSGGYQNWDIDLSAYAGSQVEVSITYAQDFATAGLGVFLDDVEIDRGSLGSTTNSFEDGLGGWTAGPPPEGSELGTQRAWTATTSVGFSTGPIVTTARSYYMGFGLEGVRGAGTRATLLSNALGFLGALGNGNGGGGGAGGGGSNNGNGPPSGTPAGTTPGGTTPPVALGRLTLIKRTLHVNRLTRRTSVRFKCPVSTASGRCTGQIRLQRGNAGLAQRAFSIPADRYTTVAVGLTRSAYRKLVKAKHLRTVVSVLTRDRLGRLQRVQATMTLVLAKR